MSYDNTAYKDYKKTEAPEVSKKVDEWYMRRWARFTASEDYKLLVPGKDEMFGTGAWTYIKQKALEMTTTMQERPELEEAKSILHGRSQQYAAHEAYVQHTKNHDLIYFGDDDPVFYPYLPLAEEAGGSPDSASVTLQGTITMGAEFKNPKNPINHFDRLDWKDQFDVRVGYPLAYTQCMKLMMCTGATQWDFVSFDDRQIVKAKRIKVIPIYLNKDKNFQNNLEVRIRCAIKEKYRIISKKYGAEVANRTDFMQKFNLVGQSF